MNVDDLDREGKVMLWVYGTMTELEAKGLLVLHQKPTVKGLALFDQLKASGFCPTIKEMSNALGAMHRQLWGEH